MEMLGQSWWEGSNVVEQKLLWWWQQWMDHNGWMIMNEGENISLGGRYS
jgi:hypothetical protein